MVVLPYERYSTKLQDYFKSKVFEVGHGPDFFDWVFENYAGEIRPFKGDNPLRRIGWDIHFKNEEDAAVFILRWG